MGIVLVQKQVIQTTSNRDTGLGVGGTWIKSRETKSNMQCEYSLASSSAALFIYLFMYLFVCFDQTPRLLCLVYYSNGNWQLTHKISVTNTNQCTSYTGCFFCSRLVVAPAVEGRKAEKTNSVNN